MAASVDDLAQRRILEVDIDKLKRSQHLEAVTLGEEAGMALKEGKLAKARVAADKGLKLIQPIKLIDFLVTEGGLASRASARRTVESGGVRVDMKRAVDVEMDIRHAKTIQIGQRTIERTSAG